MNSGRTVGAVYVCESDSERAALIGSIQRRLATITIGIGAAALMIVLLTVWFWLHRDDCSDRALVLAAALLGWGGLSVHCQTAAVLGGAGISMRWYLPAKAMQGAVSAVLAAAVWSWVI